MIRDPELQEDEEADSEDDPALENPGAVHPAKDDEDEDSDLEISPESVERRRTAEALAQRRAQRAAEEADAPRADVLIAVDGPEPDDEEPPAFAVDDDDAPSVASPLSERWVPYRDLVLEYLHWVNPRSVTGLDDASLSALASSIKAETTTDENAVYAGLHDRMKVVQIAANGSTINLVVDGQRRHRAIALAGLGDDVLVPVTDLEPDPVWWTRELAAKYLFSALEGVGTRAGLSGFELSENAERLRNEKDPDTGAEYTLAKIARAIGRSESWVSKTLTARRQATPKLLHQWKMGEITDEGFKDIARAKEAEQEKKGEEVAEARKSSGRSAARTLAKETKVKAERAAAKAGGKSSAKAAKKKADGPVVRGPQQDLPAVPPKRTPPSFAVVEDLLSTADKHPPTHDYVKGIMDGARWAVGLLDPGMFGKAWQTYIERAAGAVAKASKKAAKK